MGDVFTKRKYMDQLRNSTDRAAYEEDFLLDPEVDPPPLSRSLKIIPTLDDLMGNMSSMTTAEVTSLI